MLRESGLYDEVPSVLFEAARPAGFHYLNFGDLVTGSNEFVGDRVRGVCTSWSRKVNP